MRQIAVIGLGKFGSTVAKELTDRGAQVIAIDENKERVENLKESVAYAAVADSDDEGALRAIGIQNVDVAIVCIGENVEANLLTTLLLKKMGIKKVWSRAISPLQLEILKTLEVDNIINLEEEMGKIVANGLISPVVSKFIPLTCEHSVIEIKTPKAFIGKTIREINAREKFKVNIIAVEKHKPVINKLGERDFEKYIEHVPLPDIPLEEEDTLFIVGDNENIKKFSEQ